MAYTYQAVNLTSGIDDALISTASSVSIFTPMFLLFVFCIVFLSGSLKQKRRTGYADIPMWATISSLVTLVIALPMTLTKGLIDSVTLGIIVTITIASGFWLFNDRNRNEV